mgnify:CR=1 FL=1
MQTPSRAHTYCCASRRPCLSSTSSESVSGTRPGPHTNPYPAPYAPTPSLLLPLPLPASSSLFCIGFGVVWAGTSNLPPPKPHPHPPTPHTPAPVERVRDGPADAGLAHSGRPHQAQDLALGAAAQVRHRDELQDAVLDVLQPVVVVVQDLQGGVQRGVARMGTEKCCEVDSRCGVVERGGGSSLWQGPSGYRNSHPYSPPPSRTPPLPHPSLPYPFPTTTTTPPTHHHAPRPPPPHPDTQPAPSWPAPGRTAPAWWRPRAGW